MAANRLCTATALASIATQAAAAPLTLATSANSAGAGYQRPQAETLPPSEKRALLRQQIKYVFIIFQENRSFDSYFGTYPGANGLFETYPGASPTDPAAQPARMVASFHQHIRNTDGTFSTISPFLAPRIMRDHLGRPIPLYPESAYSVDHSHTGYIADFHLQDTNKSVALNDGYALAQEKLEYASASSSTDGSNIVVSGSAWPPGTNPPTALPTLAARQKGELALAHLDCDTIPFLWHYADLGTLFDNFHQTVIGPSTPNAIAMIAAQSGVTQWALHPDSTGTRTKLAVPNETDTPPFPGSAADTFPGRPPFGPDAAMPSICAKPGAIKGTFDNTGCPAPQKNDPAWPSFTTHSVVKLNGPVTAYAGGQPNLTFASLPLTFMGNQIHQITAQDAHPAQDLADVQHDITRISQSPGTIPWAWYQQGFGPEPFDGAVTVFGFPAATPHASYIVHHNGPQYFGYLGDNPAELANLHGLQQFYTDIAAKKLPEAGGVFFIRGGYYNNDGLQTADPSPAVRTEFAGNDDHGSYSDSQIAEAMVADTVNAIAASPYWPHSAIIITYDESDGFYDHAPEAIRSWGPDGLPLSGGPRIPTIVLSPYSTAHAVDHTYAEHGSVLKLIETIFNTTPLHALPDEQRAQALGATEFKSPNGAPQTALAPNDDESVSDMLNAFDSARLQGRAPPLPAHAVTISRPAILSLPHYAGAGCAALNITPTDYPDGYGIGLENDPPPPDFNPRPTVSPGVPYLEQTILGGQITSPWTP